MELGNLMPVAAFLVAHLTIGDSNKVAYQGPKRPNHCKLSLVQLGSNFSASYFLRSLFHTPFERPATPATHDQKYAMEITLG